MKNKLKFISIFVSVVLILQTTNVFAGNIDCSSWALDEVTNAIDIGFVPENLQSDYTKPITRIEFCTLVVNMLDSINSKILEAGSREGIYYSDTDSDAVISASAVGIVSGIGDNKFDPDGDITRQEASRMLYMTSTIGERYNDARKYFDDKVSEMNNSVIMPHIFRDGFKIQSWAQESINYCYMYGIMQGRDNNLFDVDGTYSREQAIVTAYRVYKLYSRGEISVPEREYLYAKKEDKYGIWGYINEKNQWIIEPDYENPIYNAYAFEGNYAMIDMGGASGLRMINKKGEIVYAGYRQGIRFGDIASFENNGNEGTINLSTGEVIGEAAWRSQGLRSGSGETLVPIQDIETGLYGYYNSEGNLVIPKKYKEAYTFYNNRAIVKENESYKLIDRFGSMIMDFDIFLENGEFISDAVGDIYSVYKKGKDKNEFNYIYRVGKGIILNADKDIISTDLLISGDIYAETTDGIYMIYDRTGNIKIENSHVDILYDNSANVYRAFSNFCDDIPLYRIISNDGRDIIIAADNKYGEIGNGLFYVCDNRTITIYDSVGNIFETISVENSIYQAYSDNGVVFCTDVSGTLKGYTYMGEELF